MTGTITVLGRNNTISSARTISYDTKVPESLEVANEEFARSVKEGHLATAVIKGKPTHVREFDPNVAPDYIMVPQLRGG